MSRSSRTAALPSWVRSIAGAWTVGLTASGSSTRKAKIIAAGWSPGPVPEIPSISVGGEQRGRRDAGESGNVPRDR